MYTKLKTAIAVAAAAILAAIPTEAKSQDTQPNVGRSYANHPVSISSDCECLVFSSMDWFSTVSVHNAETGETVLRMNVRVRDRNEPSQLLFVDFSGWPKSEYVIVLKGGHRAETVKLFVSDNGFMLVE